jgi:hypothetical protein
MRCGSPFKMRFFKRRSGTRDLELPPLLSSVFDNASVRFWMLGFEVSSESIRDIVRVGEGESKETERLTSAMVCDFRRPQARD